MLGILLSTSTLAATVRLSAPLALATMGSVFGHKAKIFNIGLESYVLTSAFFATWGSYLFENAFMGLLFGMASGVVMSAIFGTFVLHFKSDPIVVGIAMNLSAWGLTSLLLFNIFHIRGSIMDPRIKSFGSIDIPLLGRIPFVGELLNNHNILVYAAFAVVIVSQIVMYKTRFGLRLRGVGLNEKAIQSAGVSVTKYKWASLIITGVLAGAGGGLPAAERHLDVHREHVRRQGLPRGLGRAHRQGRPLQGVLRLPDLRVRGRGVDRTPELQHPLAARADDPLYRHRRGDVPDEPRSAQEKRRLTAGKGWIG